VRWPADVVDDMRLTAADAHYLREVGLPVGVDWNLEIEPPAAGRTPTTHHRLAVLARDGPIPICVVSEEDDKIAAMEGNTQRTVNSNICAFGAFLMLYQDYRMRVRGLGEEDALALIDETEQKMCFTDSDAMEDREGYWPLIVEQMRNGML
jgi:hypothetical protein